MQGALGRSERDGWGLGKKETGDEGDRSKRKPTFVL